MSLSARTYTGKGEFISFRYSLVEKIAPGILLHLLETALIYDMPRFNRYINLLFSFEPSFFNSFLSSLPFEWGGLNVKIFDTYISYFEAYLNRLSDLLCSHWGIDSRLLSQNREVLMFLLNCISFSLKTPIKVLDKDNETNLDDLNQYEDMSPIILSFQQSTILFFYPSLTHYQLLRRQRKEQPRTECFRCSMTRTEKEIETCEKGCKVCLGCWEENLKNLRQYRCPCCGWLQGQEVSSRLRQHFHLYFSESKEPQQDKVRSENRCQNCRKTIDSEGRKFCRNCLICFRCFRKTNTLTNNKCPGCAQTMPEEMLTQLKKALKTSRKFLTKNKAEKGISRKIDQQITRNSTKEERKNKSEPRRMFHSMAEKTKLVLPHVPIGVPQKKSNRCWKCQKYEDVSQLFLICRKCAKIVCSQCIKLLGFLNGNCQCNSAYSAEIYEHEGKKSIPDCCNKEHLSGNLQLCYLRNHIIHAEHEWCSKCRV